MFNRNQGLGAGVVLENDPHPHHEVRQCCEPGQATPLLINLNAPAMRYTYNPTLTLGPFLLSNINIIIMLTSCNLFFLPLKAQKQTTMFAGRAGDVLQDDAYPNHEVRQCCEPGGLFLWV